MSTDMITTGVTPITPTTSVVEVDTEPIGDVPEIRDLHPELLRQALGGDRRAWDLLVRAYTPLLRRIAFRYRIGDETSDAVQSTFLQLMKHGHSIRNPEALKGWLRTTVINECLHVLRRRNRERMNSDVGVDAINIPVAADQSPDHLVVRLEEIALLRRAIDGLPTRDRRLVALLNDPEIDGYRAVSERLGIPVGSIGPTRGRILVRLRDSLRSVGLEDCA